MTDNDKKNGVSTDRSSAPALVLYRCESSHTFFFPHRTCPLCGAPTREIDSPPEGVLISHTTVRVSPTGTSFWLGLARVACGAQTLCIVEGEIGSEPEEKVVIFKRGGLYHAGPRTPR
jgi:uncharacterized OB-fold protein